MSPSWFIQRIFHSKIHRLLAYNPKAGQEEEGKARGASYQQTISPLLLSAYQLLPALGDQAHESVLVFGRLWRSGLARVEFLRLILLQADRDQSRKKTAHTRQHEAKASRTRPNLQAMRLDGSFTMGQAIKSFCD
eukprot:Skav200607  [mRNA]  locus=scaffold879:97651:100936:+ [translate_table: standard]